jgi:hypothetical protein
VVVACCCDYLVAAAEHVLPHDLRRNVRVARFGEVAVRCSANEAAFALRIEPPCRFTIWNYRRKWGTLSLIPTWCTLLLLLLLPAATATTTLSASTLIAAATSVVTVIAIAAMLSLIALLLTTALSARLRVVLLLLLL